MTSVPTCHTNGGGGAAQKSVTAFPFKFTGSELNRFKCGFRHLIAFVVVELNVDSMEC